MSSLDHGHAEADPCSRETCGWAPCEVDAEGDHYREDADGFAWPCRCEWHQP